MDFENRLQADHGEAEKLDKKIADIKKLHPEKSNTEIMSEISEEEGMRIFSEKETKKRYMDGEKRKADMIRFYSREAPSDDLRKVLIDMQTETAVHQEGFSLDKILIAQQMAEHVENNVKELPFYYLGANADFNFPLALHFRNIKMIDTGYTIPEQGILKRALENIKDFAEFKVMNRNAGNVQVEFLFDFGKGKEPVTVEFITADALEIKVPEEKIGGVVTFFIGPGDELAFNLPQAYEKLAENGIIYGKGNPFNIMASRQLDSDERFLSASYDWQGDMEIRKLFEDTETEIANQYGMEKIKIAGTGDNVFVKKKNSREWLDIIKGTSKDVEASIESVLIIDKINAVFEELGSTTKWKKAPEHIEGTEILKDKTIAMVDDVSGVLEAFAPDLLVATDGKATFIQYKGQSIEELIGQVLQSKADLILLDYHLTEQLNGSEVAKELFANGFSGSVVGFSSDSHAAKDFLEAGAIGAINKEAGFPESSVKKLAELLESQRK